MSGVGIIGAIIIGIFAGWLAERAFNRRHGLLVNLCVGLVGSFIGSWAAGLVGFNYHGFLGSFLVATAGALLLLFVLGLVRRGR
jgi:uncharacterized membrane protein YeaQ/YmgE (transglycosylase-associated protein family)